MKDRDRFRMRGPLAVALACAGALGVVASTDASAQGKPAAGKALPAWAKKKPAKTPWWLKGKKKPAPAASASASADPGPPPPPTLSETLKGAPKAEYEAGKILYRSKDYKNAIVKFRTAYEKARDPRLLWNIAVCQKQLKQYSKMLHSIRLYREKADHMLTEKERQQAVRIIRTVQTFVSAFDLRVDQNDAEVFVDGESVGRTPIVSAATLDVGRRTIRIEKLGFKTVEKTVTVPGNNVVKMHLFLERELHRGILVVKSEPDARIDIDGQAMGRGTWKGSLPSGGHTLRVSAPDKATYQSDVVIADGKSRTIDVALNPVPSDPTATVLWIVGGVGLAGAAAVTAGFLFESVSDPAIEGNIAPGAIQLNHGGVTVGSW